MSMIHYCWPQKGGRRPLCKDSQYHLDSMARAWVQFQALAMELNLCQWYHSLTLKMIVVTTLDQ